MKIIITYAIIMSIQIKWRLTICFRSSSSYNTYGFENDEKNVDTCRGILNYSSSRLVDLLYVDNN
jgi:hypothetical protein